jgi:hypothetical protein
MINSKKGQVHKFITNAKAPTEDRRDDLRFQLRAKISQKDYVDKQMKVFHYNQEISANKPQTPMFNPQMNGGSGVTIPTGGDEIKLEQLKKQIENLKKCMS